MARISELHYSNAYAASSGVSEFLEVALSAGELPANYVVSFYQADGTHGLDVNLTDAGVVQTTDAQVNEEVFVISADNFPIYLTDPDGNGSTNYEAYALTDISTVPPTVIDFYDIGSGTTNIVANGGAADGAQSENLPVLVGPNSTTTTLQFNQPDPDVLTHAPLSSGDSGIACFTAGTLIDTDQGPKPIESLTAGDLVRTRDFGFQPVKWIGQRRVAGRGDFAPIRIKRGSFGNTLDLLVSPQHRMLCDDWRAALMFGADEILIAAKFLIDGDTVRTAPCDQVTYFHLLFDTHQIIFANGAPSESYFLGDQAVRELAPETADEIYALFPELRENNAAFGPTVYPTLTRAEGAVFRAAA